MRPTSSSELRDALRGYRAALARSTTGDGQEVKVARQHVRRTCALAGHRLEAVEAVLAALESEQDARIWRTGARAAQQGGGTAGGTARSAGPPDGRPPGSADSDATAPDPPQLPQFPQVWGAR